MSTFNPPPTYANPVITDETTGKAQFNPIWLKWFLDVANFVSANGGGGAVGHESLSGLLGGSVAGGHYHFTSAEHTALAAGFTGTGVLVRQTGAAFTDTPSIGNANAAIKSSVTLTDGTGVSGGALGNAPAPGNPRKWIQIDDNGTIRYIPTW